jgi:hypothetical protein
MALDVILAEKRVLGGQGECDLTGGKCCTFISNSTALDGTITKALQGLTALSNELAKNSGINDSLTNWLEQWFGKWRRVMTSVLRSLIVVFGAMALIGYCVVAGIRELIPRLVETTLTKQTPI